ncbi:MAG TPA: hypothetical protein EYF98_13630 [Planctomycetes bacterium]|nr:hypothetical protein [Planctomycetota bacterium]
MTEQPEASQTPTIEGVFRRRAYWVLSLGLVCLLGHAFVPLEEFVHRGDDAYYYFKVALNYPRYGFWTFDGINATNGVQPLWCMILTALAQVMYWMGIQSPDVISRVFVFLTAAIHFASCMVLLRLVSRTISLGAGIAAAGAFLFPLGIVWTRVWGMENSLYALLLLLTVSAYERHFRTGWTRRQAVTLGILLGLTCLARLNAGFLIPVLLAAYLISGRRDGNLSQRLRDCLVIGGVASAIILPYLAYNLATTGHAMPVSGGAKLIRSAQFLAENGIETVWSLQFLELLNDWTREPRQWFLTSRGMDGTWLTGGRLFLEDSTSYGTFWGFVAALLLGPALLGKPRVWLAELWHSLRCLVPFSYLAVFALLNVVVSLLWFPYEATYALKRWGLMEAEIVITTSVAVLAATSISFVGARLIPKGAHMIVATGALTLLTVLSATKMVTHYWDGEVQYSDWNVSTNDARYRGCLALRKKVPKGSVIGCWNAGVLGFYSGYPVVNLDGLINSWDFLPYLERNAIAEYIRDSGIEYIADTNYEVRTRAGAGWVNRLAMKRISKQHMDPYGTGIRYKNQLFVIIKVGR